MTSTALRVLVFVAGATLVATVASAQTASPEFGPWRIGASTGGYVPFSALIRAADANDTRISPGPAFAIEPQYAFSSAVSAYTNVVAAFGSIHLGSSIRATVVGPSNTVILAGGTAGVMLAPSDWFGDHLQPTFRLGGGVKAYVFDLTDAENQVRPTADIGLGLRGIGIGAIDVSAEVRYLPSTFDQSRLPTRGIATQNQRQNDLFFSVGIGVR